MDLCENCIFYDVCWAKGSRCDHFYNEIEDSIKKVIEYDVVLVENYENYEEIIMENNGTYDDIFEGAISYEEETQ